MLLTLLNICKRHSNQPFDGCHPLPTPLSSFNPVIEETEGANSEQIASTPGGWQISSDEEDGLLKDPIDLGAVSGLRMGG
jgi:hypothetical protein